MGAGASSGRKSKVVVVEQKSVRAAIEKEGHRRHEGDRWKPEEFSRRELRHLNSDPLPETEAQNKKRKHRKRKGTLRAEEQNEENLYKLLVKFNDEPESTKPFKCSISASSISDLYFALADRFKLRKGSFVVTVQDSDFDEVVQLDSLDILPRKAKIFIEGTKRAANEDMRSLQLKSNSKLENLKKFETEQLDIVSYQDALNKLVEELQKENNGIRNSLIKVPEEFMDPITHEIMRRPVVTADGHTYEKKAIKLWLKHHETSPLTNLPLKNKKLIPNVNLKQSIQSFRQKVEQISGSQVKL